MISAPGVEGGPRVVPRCGEGRHIVAQATRGEQKKLFFFCSQCLDRFKNTLIGALFILIIRKTDVLPKTYVLFIVLTVFLGPRPGALPLGEHINV